MKSYRSCSRLSPLCVAVLLRWVARIATHHPTPAASGCGRYRAGWLAICGCCVSLKDRHRRGATRRTNPRDQTMPNASSRPVPPARMRADLTLFQGREEEAGRRRPDACKPNAGFNGIGSTQRYRQGASDNDCFRPKAGILATIRTTHHQLGRSSPICKMGPSRGCV